MRTRKQARSEERRALAQEALMRQQAEEASVDLILDIVGQRLRDARLTFVHATHSSLYYRVADIRIRISDREPDTDERIWAREHSWLHCVDREYIVAPAVGDEPRAAARVVHEILYDLRDIE